jgi:uncharacterized protein (DUF1697 family)
METFIALLRGINVGGRNILPMKELTHLLEENSYQNVKTYIQSGNVVFQSKKRPEKDLSSLIEKKYGFKPEILIIKKNTFLKYVEDNPYSSTVGKEIHFYFCKDTPKVNTKTIEDLKSATENYRIKGKVLYLYAPDGIGKSKFVANIDKCLDTSVTGRNLNTINKLVEMVNNA